VQKELEVLRHKLAEAEQKAAEASKLASMHEESKTAAEKKAEEAAALAAKHENELKQAREAEATKQMEFAQKEEELKAALEAQREASSSIKASSDKEGLTLKQAKEELEEKVKGLEDELSAKRGDEEKNTETIKKLEEEMKSYMDKLGKEKEAMKAVMKLRQEKESLQEELEQARSNIVYKAQKEWLPKAQQSLKNLTSLAGDHLSIAASHAQGGLNTAANVMEEIAKTVDEHPHVQTCRQTTRPYLDRAFDAGSAIATTVLERIRYPIPLLRAIVENLVGNMGAYSQFKTEAGAATEYWLLHLPILSTLLLFSTIWMSSGLKIYCLRSQQTMFATWGLIGMVGWAYNSDGLDLLAKNLSTGHLAMFHISCIFIYLNLACVYLLSILTGRGIVLGVFQMGGVAWVVWCYYVQLVLPLLVDGHKTGAFFTRAHLLRSAVCLIFASVGSENISNRPSKHSQGFKPLNRGTPSKPQYQQAQHAYGAPAQYASPSQYHPKSYPHQGYVSPEHQPYQQPPPGAAMHHRPGRSEHDEWYGS
jgi:chemotaxis protein histidine kinase CheA